MKKAEFEELAASVREGGAILRDEANPARSFEVDEDWRLEVAPTKTQSRPAPTEPTEVGFVSL